MSNIADFSHARVVSICVTCFSVLTRGAMSSFKVFAFYTKWCDLFNFSNCFWYIFWSFKEKNFIKKMFLLILYWISNSVQFFRLLKKCLKMTASPWKLLCSRFSMLGLLPQSFKKIGVRARLKMPWTELLKALAMSHDQIQLPHVVMKICLVKV